MLPAQSTTGGVVILPNGRIFQGMRGCRVRSMLPAAPTAVMSVQVIRQWLLSKGLHDYNALEGGASGPWTAVSLGLYIYLL